MAEKSTLRVETYRSPTSVDAERRGAVSGAKAKEDALLNMPVDRDINVNDVKSFMKQFSAPTENTNSEDGINVDAVNSFMKNFALPQPKTAVESGPPVVTKDGVRDSKTGELVVGGKPFTNDNMLDQARSFVHGALDIPIVGPAITGGIERGAAAIRSIKDNTKFADELQDIQNRNKLNVAAYPTTNTVGKVAGNIAAMTPAMMAAPAAFGIGGGSLATNALVSGVTNAGISAADEAVRAEPGNRLDAAKKGAMIGGSVGLAAPVLGAVVGAGANKVFNKLSGTTPEARNISGVLDEIGMTPQQAKNDLRNMGPNAFLADVDPALAMEAGGLASMGGKPTSVLYNAAKSRAATADDIVARGVEKSLGIKPELELVQQKIIEDAQKAASPYYKAMEANPPKMDVSAIVGKIDNELVGAVGGKASNLQKIKDMLIARKVDTPNGKMIVLKDDAKQLLSVRQEIDGLIEKAPQNPDTTAAKSAVRVLEDFRKKIDGLLKTDSNIAAGDLEFSKFMKVKDAVAEGTELFKRSTKPDTFIRELATKTPEQIDGLRQGARVAIGDALEQASRGELAQAKTMFGKNSANRTKLDALFPQASEIFDLIATEASKRATENTIISNSLTASRQAVQRKYRPQSADSLSTVVPALVGEAASPGGVGAIVGAGGKMFWDAIKNSFNEASRNKLIEGTARGLTATGKEQDEFMRQIMRAQKTNNVSNKLVGGSTLGTNLLTNVGGNRARD